MNVTDLKWIKVTRQSLIEELSSPNTRPTDKADGTWTLGRRLEVVEAVTSLLKRLDVRPPSQIQFRTIANVPTTAAFSRKDLLNALYTLEYEGTISVHDDNSFSVLKPSTAL